jgi:hypothetical protein
MTTQARPDWNAEMDRQIKATESAQALVNDHEKTIREQRQVIEQLRGALRRVADMPIGEYETVEDGDISCEQCCRIDAIARIALEAKPE